MKKCNINQYEISRQLTNKSKYSLLIAQLHAQNFSSLFYKSVILKLLLVLIIPTFYSCNVCDGNGGEREPKNPKILFTTKIDGINNVYEISENGSNLSELVLNANLAHASSNTFSFTRRSTTSDTLFVFDGNIIEVSTAIYPDKIINPVMSVNFQEIYYNEGNGRLINTDMYGSLELVSDKYFDKYLHSLSNGQDKLAFIENEGDDLYLIVVSTDNKLLKRKKLEQFFEYEKLNLELNWSKYDTKLIFTGRKDDKNAIIEYDFNADNFNYLFTQGLVAINPIYVKEAYILFATSTGELWIYDREKDNFIVLNEVYQGESFIYNSWSQQNQLLLSHLKTEGIEENSVYTFKLDFAENTVKIINQIMINNKANRAFWQSNEK